MLEIKSEETSQENIGDQSIRKALGHYLPAECDPKSTFKEILCPYPAPTNPCFSTDSRIALVAHDPQRKDGQAWRAILGRAVVSTGKQSGRLVGKRAQGLRGTQQQLQSPEATDQL